LRISPELLEKYHRDIFQKLIYWREQVANIFRSVSLSSVLFGLSLHHIIRCYDMSDRNLTQEKMKLEQKVSTQNSIENKNSFKLHRISSEELERRRVPSYSYVL
ncbi:MAG: hypothetical protein Q4E59_03160, partial [Bacteroidales bacterium]|nr:hypothetical protein [Bacteroidales bacterium]